MSRQDKQITERHTRTLRELVKRPENKVCADCKKNGELLQAKRDLQVLVLTVCFLDPRWASWNLSVLRVYLRIDIILTSIVPEVSLFVFDALGFIAAWEHISVKSSR